MSTTFFVGNPGGVLPLVFALLDERRVTDDVSGDLVKNTMNVGGIWAFSLRPSDRTVSQEMIRQDRGRTYPIDGDPRVLGGAARRLAPLTMMVAARVSHGRRQDLLTRKRRRLALVLGFGFGWMLSVGNKEPGKGLYTHQSRI